MKRKKPPVKDQRAILRFQKNRCAYCDAKFGSFRVVRGRLECVDIQWDHVIPFSYTLKNEGYVAACGRCNRHKSNRHILPQKQWKPKPKTIPEFKERFTLTSEQAARWKWLNTTVMRWARQIAKERSLENPTNAPECPADAPGGPPARFDPLEPIGRPSDAS